MQKLFLEHLQTPRARHSGEGHTAPEPGTRGPRASETLTYLLNDFVKHLVCIGKTIMERGN